MCTHRAGVQKWACVSYSRHKEQWDAGTQDGFSISELYSDISRDPVQVPDSLANLSNPPPILGQIPK